MTHATNGIPAFAGFVDHFMIPISSEESGLGIIDQLRTVAATRCQ